MEPIIVKFSKPVEFNGDTISQVELREPLFEDLDGIPLDKINDSKYLRIIVSRISGLEIAALKKLGMIDALELFKALSGFFPSTSQPQENPED